MFLLYRIICAPHLERSGNKQKVLILKIYFHNRSKLFPNDCKELTIHVLTYGNISQKQEQKNVFDKA